ncbi:hypothetical protein [Gulosibacter bifidus]|uniref:SRPBCC family protein n=1 Tax=Gulosibacter bifidus TaxID=272239 RepID=A0ABW5RFK3_9MICO|nr:hypothetical protein [Gulosibacter bifidus]
MDIHERILALNIAPRFSTAADTATLELTFLTDGADPQTVWGYITQPDQLLKWSPIVPDRPLTEVGEAMTQETPDADALRADVLSVDPGHELVHRWGDDVITWRLSGDRLECINQLAIPEMASYNAAGWQICFGILAATLEGETHDRIVGKTAMEYCWPELQARYAEQFAQ